MRTPVSLLLATLALLPFSCREAAAAPEVVLDGIWEAAEYGRYLVIEEGAYRYYERAGGYCYPDQAGRVADFGGHLRATGDTLRIRLGISDVYCTRVRALPEVCSRTWTAAERNDPVRNFAVLTRTVAEYYPYFERNGIDGDSLLAAYGARVGPQTTPAELYRLLDALIAETGDNHGYLEADRDYATDEAEPGDTTLRDYGDFEVADLITEAWLDEELTRDSWLLRWGRIDDRIGYLQVKAMWLHADLTLPDSLVEADGFVGAYVDAFHRMNPAVYPQREAAAVRQRMEAVMEDLHDTEYLVLDVRFNGGGQDLVSQEILRPFVRRPYAVGWKRGLGPHGPTARQWLYQPAATGRTYSQPVYLLTSRQTASAADYLALASLPHRRMRRVGAPTRGALSDALEKRLPNGWAFSISNEWYADARGNIYESRGIPPDVALDYPDDRQTFFRRLAADPGADRDRVLAAIARLREARR